MKVYTHKNVDLDAAASVWFAQNFIIDPPRSAELVFVSANWDGTGMGDEDMALDIRAAGRGIKGYQLSDGTVGSCLDQLVTEYAPRFAQDALRSLVEFVDAQDAHGQAVKRLAPEAGRYAQTVLADTGLNGVLRALQAQHPGDDKLVVELMSEIFFGMLKVGEARQRAAAEANRAELIGDGRVAIVRDKREMATNAILFDRGVRVVVYQDGHNIGVVREGSETLPMDHPALLAVIHAAGEEIGDGDGKWFVHPAKFMIAWGTLKAPAASLSRVRPEDLAQAAARLLASKDRQAATEHQPTPRTIERLLADLRDHAKLDLAVLELGPTADPAHMRRLLLEGWADSHPAHMGRWLLSALQHVQGVGVVGHEVYVHAPEVEHGVHPASTILARFPYVEVALWDREHRAAEPVIEAIYRFAPHPLAPHTRVRFAIGYAETPDGGDNLVYTIGEIEEEEAQDPQGA
jgi:hypothetical protein